jgi:hypothetical protein
LLAEDIQQATGIISLSLGSIHTSNWWKGFFRKMKVSVLLCFLVLLSFHIDVSVSRAINCANKRWHGSLGCQQVEELKQMRREMQNNERG